MDLTVEEVVLCKELASSMVDEAKHRHYFDYIRYQTNQVRAYEGLPMIPPYTIEESAGATLQAIICFVGERP